MNLDLGKYLDKSKFRILRGSKWSHGGLRTPTNGSLNVQMELWKICRPVVINSHHCDEEHLSAKSNLKQQLKKGTLFCIKVKKWIQNEI